MDYILKTASSPRPANGKGRTRINNPMPPIFYTPPGERLSSFPIGDIYRPRPETQPPARLTLHIMILEGFVSIEDSTYLETWKPDKENYNCDLTSTVWLCLQWVSV